MRCSEQIRIVSRRAGFTLVEATISVLVVATMMVAALNVVGASAKARLCNSEQAQGLTLANLLLAEIMQCPYQDPNTETGETRARWDDVSDYNNLTENPPKDKNGAALPGYSGWTRQATVGFVNPNAPDSIVGSDKGLKRIAVTVTSPTGTIVTLTGLRSKYSAYDHQLTAQTTYVSRIDVSLQLGSDAGTGAASSVNLLNQAP